jgi:hypothetical protein
VTTRPNFFKRREATHTLLYVNLLFVLLSYSSVDPSDALVVTYSLLLVFMLCDRY